MVNPLFHPRQFDTQKKPTCISVSNGDTENCAALQWGGSRDYLVHPGDYFPTVICAHRPKTSPAANSPCHMNPVVHCFQSTRHDTYARKNMRGNFN